MASDCKLLGATETGVDGRKLIRIDITSDFHCFWCYVSKKRLEKAISMLDPAKVDVQVTWSPYMLNSCKFQPGSIKHQVLTEKFGSCFSVIKARAAALKETDGVNIEWDGPICDALNAHRLTLWAKDKGKQNQVVEEIFSRYLELGMDVSRIDVLTDAAAVAGLDREEVYKFLSSDALTQEVKQLAESSIAKGVTGVPHFVVNNKFQFSGAQPLDFLLCVFAKLGVYDPPPGQKFQCTAQEAPATHLRCMRGAMKDKPESGPSTNTAAPNVVPGPTAT